MRKWLKKYWKQAVEYWERINTISGTIPEPEDIYETMVDFFAEDTGLAWEDAERIVFEALDEEDREMFGMAEEEEE